MRRGFAVAAVSALGAVLALGAQATSGPTTAPASAPADGGRLLDAVWQKVRDEFHDPALCGLDWDALRARYRPLVQQAGSPREQARLINEMLENLHASHTQLLTPADWKYYALLDVFKDGPLSDSIGRLFPSGRVRYTGIGVFVTILDGKTFVSGLLAGFPAERAGLQVGDEILSADGQPFHPIESFTGKAGTVVALRVRPTPDPHSARDVAVLPTEIEPAEAFLEAEARSIRIEERGGRKIGYIHVWSYAGQVYHELLRGETSAGRLKDADGLVIDLRDGVGGANPEYLDLFNRNVPVLRHIRRDGTAQTWDPHWRKPVVLLVNGGTTSGKEIFAYGFKKYRLGRIVGTRTAGAVLGGAVFLMPGDNLLYLAVCNVTVDGERLEGVGVTPDIEVSYPLPYSGGKDPQLERAMDLLEPIP